MYGNIPPENFFRFEWRAFTDFGRQEYRDLYQEGYCLIKWRDQIWVGTDVMEDKHEYFRDLCLNIMYVRLNDPRDMESCF